MSDEPKDNEARLSRWMCADLFINLLQMHKERGFALTKKLFASMKGPEFA